MKLTAVVKIKNGYLWEAVQKCGGVGKLAKYLGIHQGQLSGLLNLHTYPYWLFTDNASKDAEKWREVENKLLLLIGVGFEEIFPKELSSRAFNEKTKSYAITRDVPVESLTGMDEKLLTTDLEETERKIDSDNLHQRFEEIFKTLTPREAEIIKLRFGLIDGEEHFLEDVAERFGVTRERIRQIEVRVLRKLRHPSRANLIRGFFDGEPESESDYSSDYLN